MKRYGGASVFSNLSLTPCTSQNRFCETQVDLWTETLESEEYDALAMMIAKGVTNEVEITEEQPDSGKEEAAERSGNGILRAKRCKNS